MQHKLICLDMDGVIFKDINFWMELHKKFDTYEEGVEVTNKYLQTDYQQLVREVVGRLWKGKDAAQYYKLIQSLEYNPGVQEAFAHIKQQGYKTAIISASALDAVRRVQKDFGVDFIYGNELVIRDGKVSGEFVWPIGAGSERKAAIIRELCKTLGISPQQCIYIGDSDTDLEAFKEVGISIAFNCASEKLKQAATHVVDSKNLAEVIKYIP